MIAVRLWLFAFLTRARNNKETGGSGGTEKVNYYDRAPGGGTGFLKACRIFIAG